MEIKSKLYKRCHVNNNFDGDRFVGIKADTNGAKVYFPIGYELPKIEQELRKDILHLISILNQFTELKDKLLSSKKSNLSQIVNFPINAYLEIINSFMEQNSYYVEKEPEYKITDRGKIDWARTIKKEKPIIQSNGTPIYSKFSVRVTSPNHKNLITQIHKYCVFESFSKLGWLFTTYLPEKPIIKVEKRVFLSVLYKKLSTIYNDKDKRLFSAMIDMIEYLDNQKDEKQLYFGTNQFEYVWEKLIDKVFGIKNKKDYFPKSKWILRLGKKRTNSALEPDTIMIHSNKIFVLDAKYYRFGITGNPNDLPNSSSINKQITYGEYVYTQNDLKNRDLISDGNIEVYNAFIMPYNSNDNLFNSDKIFMNIGEATGDWKIKGFKYEKVQGILVDIRFLMHHYTGQTKNHIIELAKIIEDEFKFSQDNTHNNSESIADLVSNQ